VWAPLQQPHTATHTAAHTRHHTLHHTLQRTLGTPATVTPLLHMCYSVLQCVEVCVLQRVAVFGSVPLCAAVCTSHAATKYTTPKNSRADL